LNFDRKTVMLLLQGSILQRLKSKLGQDFNVNDHVYVDNNLVKLHVYFKDIAYKNFTESPSYSVSLLPERKHSSIFHCYVFYLRPSSSSPQFISCIGNKAVLAEN